MQITSPRARYEKRVVIFVVSLLFFAGFLAVPQVAYSKDFSSIIGSSHASGKYYFTDRDFVNEGAIAVAKAGMRVIKIWFDDPAGYYMWNSNWPDKFDNYVEMARHPYYQELFNRPFETYVLTLFHKVDFHDGVPDPLPMEVEQRYYELAKHLLLTYRGTGKTFIIGHHEGDWHLRGTTKRTPEYDPSEKSIQGMIRWYKARQRGVDRAKREIPAADIRVFHAAEVNLVKFAMEGRPTVTNNVLPYVNCDLVSYSAYDTSIHTHREENEARWRKIFRQALDYIDTKVADKPPFGSKNIFISEYGGPEQQWGGDGEAAEQLSRLCKATIEEAAAWGCPYIIYWQVYCNECCQGGDDPCIAVGGSHRGARPAKSNRDCRGFWMIKPDGTHSSAWDYFTSLTKPYLAAPDDFTAKLWVDQKKVRLAWTESPDKASSRLEKSVNRNPYILVDNSPVGRTFYDDSDIKPGNKYRYRVRFEKNKYPPTSWFYTRQIQY
ncbi:MAG: hypothetical protein JSV03_15115 [Planctomycetota bacterium]|nr:MAG: hypothetical protein JSV03_15115 [Planctomycetota bacterium]